MTHTVYIEKAIKQHPRVESILKRSNPDNIIEINHHGEILNPKSQNFRLQKNNPALVLAQKNNHRVLETPPGYGIGGNNNYYFSHMLNCLYDCRYCFLQGMYRSAHQVIFVNYEDFIDDIKHTCQQFSGESVWFFSGYDCDSLAYEPVTHFIEFFHPEFLAIENAWLEIRTKSTQIRQLLKQQASPRTIVAFSFTDDAVHRHSEHQVPGIQKRIDAMIKLADAGWLLGLRFDPLIYHSDYQLEFENLLESIFKQIDIDQIHSVSLGNFRLPKQNFKTMHQLYPQEKIFNQNFSLENGKVSYPRDIQQEMMEYCTNLLSRYVPESLFFPCS